MKKLQKPRAVWLMVPAAVVDQTIADLLPHLERDDILIDGGNSYYVDDIRRAKELTPKGIHYVDVGTSGGVWGLERGYCMMIGGGAAAVKHLDPIFAALALGIGDIARTPGRENAGGTSELGFVVAGSDRERIAGRSSSREVCRTGLRLGRGTLDDQGGHRRGGAGTGSHHGALRALQLQSGIILQDEMIHQSDSKGTPLADLVAQQGIIPGIKVDNGAKPLAGAPGESITEGLDGLRDRLKAYRGMGARFAKWRAVITVSDTLPSATCVQVNAHALARYASLCQEQGVVPIVEPEVLMDGSHTIERCEEVTGNVLHAVFNALFDQKVSLEGMLLKPNMVISGKECIDQASVKEVALATLRCLRRHVPAAVPGIVFLSGGQDHLAATTHLNAINQLEGPKPWTLSFSCGRALQDEALEAWHGKSESLKAGQRMFHHRAKCESAAALGRYTTAMEGELPRA